ncbi:MAG: tyrosine-type recombinase/integrase, partial [Nanoarchaeota archaeon]
MCGLHSGLIARTKQAPMEIYNYEKRLQSLERNIDLDSDISKENKILILKFKEECFAHNIGLARVVRYLYCLRDMARWLKKGFALVKTDEIKSLVASIERMSKYSPRTKCEYRATLKKFYKWLKKNDSPEEISWLKLNFKPHNTKLPSELPNEEDITKMLNFTKNPRDRAVIMSLYESGCRVGEFIKLRIKDISFDNYGCLIDVTGKTGGRRIRLVNSSVYLTELINKHPDKDNPNSFLWLKNNTLEMIEYPALCKLLRVSAQRANVKKKVNPHNFRHSRATYLANKLTEQQLKIFFGWTRSSDMASVYVHLSGRDVNEALLNTYGIKTEESKEPINKLGSKECFRCKTKNEDRVDFNRSLST